MYGPMAGNAMVVNFLMRWPILFPVAVLVGVTANANQPAERPPIEITQIVPVAPRVLEPIKVTPAPKAEKAPVEPVRKPKVKTEKKISG
jgi:hypothetical protein